MDEATLGRTGSFNRLLGGVTKITADKDKAKRQNFLHGGIFSNSKEKQKIAQDDTENQLGSLFD